MVMTQDPNTNMFCHREVESVLLWPETQDQRRAKTVKFSLYPPQKDRNLVEDADWYCAKIDRSGLQFNPIRYRTEKSLTCYKVEPTEPEKRYKSSLNLAIPPRALLVAAGVNVEGEEPQKEQRYKRSVEISQRYKHWIFNRFAIFLCSD